MGGILHGFYRLVRSDSAKTLFELVGLRLSKEAVPEAYTLTWSFVESDF